MTSCCYFEHASFCFHSVHQLLDDCLIVLGINGIKPYLFLHPSSPCIARFVVFLCTPNICLQNLLKRFSIAFVSGFSS